MALTLATAPSTERRQGERARAGLRVTGTMATGGRGYWVEADLLVDLATRAVVQCDVEVHDTGNITIEL